MTKANFQTKTVVKNLDDGTVISIVYMVRPNTKPQFIGGSYVYRPENRPLFSN